MAIDRIGKGAAPPQVPETAGPGAAQRPAGTGAAFEVERRDPAAPSAAEHTSGVDAASPLARLRAGEVDVDGYIDLKVEEATSALHGLDPSELADIKSVLRDQMRTDPALVDLVHAATGKMPTPPED